MMDLSDGLSQDLGHICDASHIGAELDLWKVPIHSDAQNKSDPLSAALSDGEDFELLFTLAEDQIEHIPSCINYTIIGRCNQDIGQIKARRHSSEAFTPLERKGFKHDG